MPKIFNWYQTIRSNITIFLLIYTLEVQNNRVIISLLLPRCEANPAISLSRFFGEENSISVAISTWNYVKVSENYVFRSLIEAVGAVILFNFKSRAFVWHFGCKLFPQIKHRSHLCWRRERPLTFIKYAASRRLITQLSRIENTFPSVRESSKYGSGVVSREGWQSYVR